ncbi:MAG: phage tail protein [Planctomycetota bacterium]|jgi:microcystin-dependent protein
MSEPFIAEIRIFAGNFAPRNWAFCNGQLLPIAQNTALFSLIGTTYAGDGRNTTALPNLEGRSAMHPGSGPGLTTRRLGQTGGVETVTLSEGQIAQHNHNFGTSGSPASLFNPNASTSVVARANGNAFQTTTNANLVPLKQPETVGNTGGSSAHNNRQPYLTLNFIIALQGIYPSRN